MPNQLPPWLEERVLAFCLGHPGLGPRRIAAQLGLAEWGGQPVSASGVFNTLRRHGLNTRRKRLSLVAGYAAPPEPERAPMPQPQHLDVEKPGDLVQFDCFHISRLSGTKGRVWQYTAIDVASAYLWAEIHTTELNPSATFTSALARRVADELAAAGWQLKAVLTDNGSEFRSQQFGNAVRARGAKQRFIRAGRPQTNGCVERVQRNHPRGVLAAHIRSVAGSEVHRPPAATWSSTSTTTTGTEATPGEEAPGTRSAWQSTVLERCAQRDRQLSPHLESRTA